jgi:hypothetical protein
MFCQPLTGGENLQLDPLSGVPVVFRDRPPNRIKVLGSLRVS